MRDGRGEDGRFWHVLCVYSMYSYSTLSIPFHSIYQYLPYTISDSYVCQSIAVACSGQLRAC